MTILGKKQMSEEDIKLNYITPVILNGWKGHITIICWTIQMRISSMLS